MYSTLTIKELLEAKEGKEFSLKKQKIVLIQMRRLAAAALWQIAAGENGFWFLKFPVVRLAFLYRQTAWHGGMRETV